MWFLLLCCWCYMCVSVCVCVCVCVYLLLSCVLVLCKSMDCSLPVSSVHGLLQARILEWAAILFFRVSAWSRDWAWVSCIEGRFFTFWVTRDAPADVSLHQLNPPGFSSLICRLCLLYLSCLFSDKRWYPWIFSHLFLWHFAKLPMVWLLMSGVTEKKC